MLTTFSEAFVASHPLFVTIVAMFQVLGIMAASALIIFAVWVILGGRRLDS